MLATLDNRTLFVAVAAVQVITTIGLIQVALVHPHVRGPRLWAIAQLGIAAGVLLFGLTGHAPPFVTVVLGNVLLMASVAMLNAGVRAFAGLPPRAGVEIAALAAAVGLHLAFFYGVDAYAARVIVVSGYLVATIGRGTRVLVRLNGARLEPVAAVTAGAFLVPMVLMAARGVAVLSGGPQETSVVGDSGLLVAVLLCGLCANVLWTLGLSLLVSQKVATELRAAQRELRHLANTDPLTGALNRREFVDRAARSLERGRRLRNPSCLALMDLDHFKRINDTWGHDLGDQVLRSVVSAVAAQVRATDVFSRIGGEEFALLLVDTDLDGAQRVVARIRNALGDLAFDTAEGLAVRTSVGLYPVQPNTAVEECLRRADLALYAAKESGRDRVCVWAELAPQLAAGGR